MNKIIVITFLISIVQCIDVVPLMVASHRLVRGIKQELKEQNPLGKQDGPTVTNMLKHLITQCSSDAYVILDMPGLNVYDMNDDQQHNWQFLRKYMSISSTVLGVPYVKDVLDLDHIKEYISTTCDAELMNANIEDDQSIDYIDARKKIISIEFNDLNQYDKFERINQINRNDEFVRRIIRKLPSPHYSIILTSSTKSSLPPIPQVVIESEPDSYGIFNQITNHPSRQQEVELNNPYKREDPHWNEDRNTNKRYLHNKQQDQVKVLDYELWMKHEKLIMTIIIMIMTVGMIRLKKLFSYVLDKGPTLGTDPDLKKSSDMKKNHSINNAPTFN